MNAVRRLLRDPLLHFLAAGACLFLLFLAVKPAGKTDDPRLIVVDRASLLTFIQYRSKTFQPEVAEQRLRALKPDQLKRLVDEYVREEALYREAKSLGLESNDYIIKRRMIQKVDFIAQGFADATVEVSDERLRKYFEANSAKYREAPYLTFTHVFFSTESRPVHEATTLAQRALEELRRRKIPFSDAPKHGERFPFGVNFVERTQAHIESQFGAAMTGKLFELEPDDARWAGPFTSPYGVHLVMLVNKQNVRLPALAEIRGRVEADLRSDHIKEQSEKAITAIIKTYRVKVALDGQKITEPRE
jgi:hypothetical protein